MTPDTTSRPLSSPPVSSDSSCGARLVAADGRELLLASVAVQARAGGGRAWVELRQRFENPYAEPLRLRYAVPLPADAAVAGYEFTVGDERVRGAIRSREQARAQFEQALMEGRSAALLQQERSSLFSQEIGNVPAGQAVEVVLELDVPLHWLPQGAWEFRFPTVVAPRYLGAPGRVSDGARVDAPVVEEGARARCTLALDVHEAGLQPADLGSPSHALAVEAQESGVRVGLRAREGALLDRDLVVRWSVGAARPGVRLERARPASDHPRSDSSFGLLTLVPELEGPERQAVPRDLIVLLDTSGSMAGEPLDQARRVIERLLQSLGEADTLELIEFSQAARRWAPTAQRVDAASRASALRWLRGLRASGGTEMLSGVREALAGVREDAQRQVLLVSDGLIGFEAEVVGAIEHALAPSSRLHVLGVGHGVNRSLTAAAARAGRGWEAVVAPGDDVQLACERLLAATEQPLVVDLCVEGEALRSCAMRALPDLHAGAPVRLPLELASQGGTLRLRGRTARGVWSQELNVAPCAPGDGQQGLGRLWARERVEDLELRVAAGAERGPLDARIEELGLQFGIATRRTSFVAIASRSGVDPREPVRSAEVPQELAAGLHAEALGLRAPLPMAAPVSLSAPAPAGMAEAAEEFEDAALPSPAAAPRLQRRRSLFGGLGKRSKAAGGAAQPRKAGGRTPLECAARLVLCDEECLVLEFEPPADAAWQATRFAQLRLDDGSELRVALDRKRSTRSGRVAAGSTVRVVVRLAAPLSAGVAALVVGSFLLRAS